MSDTLLVVANWVVACATVVAAKAAIGSARSAQQAVNDQQKNFERQLNEYKLTLFAETALKFEEKFNNPDFKQIRSKAAKALLNTQHETEAEDVFDFFETLGMFIKRGALDERIAYSTFFHWINLYWKAGKHHIGSRRQDATSLWGDFEALYRAVTNIETRSDPNSEDLKMPEALLRKYLQEEIELIDDR